MAKKKPYVRDMAIYSALRRAHRNSPEYREALTRAKEAFFIKSKKGKDLRRVRFSCALCGAKGSRKTVAVDHIEPVVPVTGRTTFDAYIDRLWCGIDGLQILCNSGHTSCHKLKSKVENSLRRKHRKES